MSKKKKVLIVVVALLILILCISFISGYRFTSESAAKANYFVGNNSTLSIKVASSMGEVYVYKKNNYYITDCPQRYGFLWMSNISFNTQYINDKKDLVRSIGWFSETSLGTVMIIQSNDKRVSYFESKDTTTESNNQIEKVNDNGIAVFDFNNGSIPNCKFFAYSSNGKILYTYGSDPSTPNYTDSKEIRWRETT